MNRAAFLIPHFNNPQGLADSLASVGADECVDAVIVDDGSVRAPLDEALCRAAWRAQGTLKFYYLPHNCGIEYALNTGLEAILADGYEFVARLDCDDLCVSDRIARQISFLEQYPKVYLLGSAVTFFDASGDRFSLNQPQTHAQIVKQMHKDNAFTHPSVMFRTAGVRELGLYPMDYPAAEDFAYFWAFVMRYQTANLPEVLTRTEYNDSGISMRRRRQQQAMRIKLLARYFDWRPVSALNIAKAAASYLLPVSLTRKIKRMLGVGTWN